MFTEFTQGFTHYKNASNPKKNGVTTESLSRKKRQDWERKTSGKSRLFRKRVDTSPEREDLNPRATSRCDPKGFFFFYRNIYHIPNSFHICSLYTELHYRQVLGASASRGIWTRKVLPCKTGTSAMGELAEQVVRRATNSPTQSNPSITSATHPCTACFVSSILPLSRTNYHNQPYLNDSEFTVSCRRLLRCSVLRSPPDPGPAAQQPDQEGG